MGVDELFQSTKLLVKISSTKSLNNLTDEELHLLVKIIRVNLRHRKRKRDSLSDCRSPRFIRRHWRRSFVRRRSSIFSSRAIQQWSIQFSRRDHLWEEEWFIVSFFVFRRIFKNICVTCRMNNIRIFPISSPIPFPMLNWFKSFVRPSLKVKIDVNRLSSL